MNANTVALPSDLREIAEGFCVSGQVMPEQMAAIAEAGFAAVICNRPDGEVPGQPDAATVGAKAADCGLAFFYIPVVHGVGITRENVEATRDALSKIEGPVFAYCRSGARSTNLFLIANS